MQLEERKIWIKEKLHKVDWNLLIFLLLFLNVKLAVKLVALVFIYWKRFNFSFKFSLKQHGLPFFYPVMIGIALLNFLLYGLFRDSHYSFLLLTGIIFWIMCILALHQVALSVTQSSLEKLHNALLIFFVLNGIVSFFNIFSIIAEIGELTDTRAITRNILLALVIISVVLLSIHPPPMPLSMHLGWSISCFGSKWAYL
jgi:hypothetical protein